MPARMHEDEVPVDEALVHRLLADQLPELADRPLRIVEPWGTDNAIGRLGDDLVVRLPRIRWAADQPDKEARWLPELRSIPTDGAPPAHNRARPIQDYDEATRRAIHSARHLIDADAALDVWEAALAAPPHAGPPVWVHGDLEGNCLVTGGRLSGLVDWGSACIGDPAVDVQVVWSPLCPEPSGERFLELVDADGDTIARARGAAVNQACAALPYYLDTYPLIVERSRHKLQALGIAVRDGGR